MRKTKSSGQANERAGTPSAMSQENAIAIGFKAIQSLAPGGAEARLRWLIDFSQQDLAQLSEGELVAHESRLAFICAEENWSIRPAPTPTSGVFTVDARRLRRSLGRIQSPLRDYFHTLERNEGFYLPMQPRTVWLFLRRPPANGEGWRLSDGPVRQETTGPQLVLLAHRLLGTVGPGKLMACPLVRHGGDAPCGRLFLAVRRQIYCSVKDARAAAFAAWLRKHHGGTRAKK